MANDPKQLKRDIETLRESMRGDWKELDFRSLTAVEREGIIHHAKWAANELGRLVLTLEAVRRFEEEDA